MYKRSSEHSCDKNMKNHIHFSNILLHMNFIKRKIKKYELKYE